jgi:hypothetical protein
MTSIQSIFGETYVNQPEVFDILPNSILSLFKCPITQEYFTLPVCLPSGMIYDKSAIITWLSLHDTDPLTGLKILPQELKLIPMCNMILCMKCIVVDGDVVKFYNPYGYLADLLHLVYETLESNEIDFSYNSDLLTLTYYKLKQKKLDPLTYNMTCDKIERIIKPNIKSMDLRDLFMCDLTYSPAVELAHDFNYKYYSFVEIINSCCLTNKPLYKHALLTQHGALIHEECLILNKSSMSCGGKLSDGWYSVLNIKPIICLDMLEVKEVSSDFKLDIQRPIKGLTSTIDDIVINIHACKWPSSRIYISIKKPEIFTDWYLQCKSSEEHMYIKYSSYVPTQFIKSRLQEFYKQITTGADNNQLITFKNSLQIPNVESTYTSDFSYMTISQTKYFDRYNKMSYFCFSHFDNVVIRDASFECCNFTGATGKIIFINCKFGVSNKTINTFYKSNLDMRFLLCEFSKESAAALPDKYKSMFE